MILLRCTGLQREARSRVRQTDREFEAAPPVPATRVVADFRPAPPDRAQGFGIRATSLRKPIAQDLRLIEDDEVWIKHWLFRVRRQCCNRKPSSHWQPTGDDGAYRRPQAWAVAQQFLSLTAAAQDGLLPACTRVGGGRDLQLDEMLKDVADVAGQSGKFGATDGLDLLRDVGPVQVSVVDAFACSQASQQRTLSLAPAGHVGFCTCSWLISHSAPHAGHRVECPVANALGNSVAAVPCHCERSEDRMSPVLRRWPTLDAMRGLPGWSGQSLKQGG